MKQKKTNKKLELKKETIAVLVNTELDKVKGGLTFTTGCGCTYPPLCQKD